MSRLHINCRNLEAVEEWEELQEYEEQGTQHHLLQPPRNIQLEAYERRARERRKYRRRAKFTAFAPEYAGR